MARVPGAHVVQQRQSARMATRALRVRAPTHVEIGRERIGRTEHHRHVAAREILSQHVRADRIGVRVETLQPVVPVIVVNTSGGVRRECKAAVRGALWAEV
jgi:hypothetical protein